MQPSLCLIQPSNSSSLFSFASDIGLRDSRTKGEGVTCGNRMPTNSVSTTPGD
jgi:hypothetical protein